MNLILAAAAETEPAFGVAMPVWVYVVVGVIAVGAIVGGLIVRSKEKQKKIEKGKR